MAKKSGSSLGRGNDDRFGDIKLRRVSEKVIEWRGR